MMGRSLALSRLIAAPVGRVWRLWTDPALLPGWFGPDGYTCTTEDIDLRAGGHWLFAMTGPDGRSLPTRHRYLQMEPPGLLAYLLDSGAEDEAPVEVTVTLTPDSGGTRIRQELTFPSPAARSMAVGFGAVERGQQMLARLARQAESP